MILASLCLAISLGGTAGLAGDEDTRTADEALLRAAGCRTEGPALLDFLRRQVPSADDQARLDDLIRKLDGDNFQIREKAAADLVAAGPKAVASLRRAASGATIEFARRAQKCIEKIEEGANPEAPAAAVRLLKDRKPEGTITLLLDYLPQVKEDDHLEVEVLLTLLALGLRDGKPEEVFAKCLSDRSPQRRSAAAFILGYHGSEEQRKQVKGLLADADMRVRLRAAQGLLNGKDKSAVPALLELVSEAPLPVAERALDLLSRLAEKDSPSVPLGANEAKRRQCRDAWETWWKTAEAKLDLARADIDLIPRDWSRGARQLVEKYLRTIEKGERRTALIGYPFCLLGQAGNKEEPISEFMDALGIGVKLGGMSFSVDRVAGLDEYDAKKSDPGAAEFVNGLRKNEVRAVFVETKIGGKVDGRFNYVLLVRYAAGQMKVIGFLRATGRQ